MTMSAADQYILELINRARLDPAGEAARLGIDLNEGLAAGTISATPKDPYAPNAALQNAAHGHSAFMDAVDQMAHVGIGDGTDIQRMQNAGYTPIGSTWYGENIAWVGSSGAVDEATAAYQNYVNLFIDTFASDRGHRLNLLSDTFREIGVGEVVGTMRGSDGVLYNAAIVTQDFGLRGTDHFITGVAYNDLNNNHFYDIGEGRGGISVTVGANAAATETAGGYSVAYPGGNALVTFSGGGLPASIGVTVEGGTHSVKVDLIGNDTVAVSQSATLGANAVGLVLLGIEGLSATGNDLANTITGNSAANVIHGAGGVDTIIGGLGADTMYGGTGSDTYYVDNANDLIVENGFEGDDLVIASVSYTLGGSIERLTLSGSANINAYGNGLDNVLTGNSGANVIVSGAGLDTMIGGTGSDTYYVANSADSIFENGFEGDDLVVASVSYDIRGASLERLTLSGSGNTTAIGNSLDNVITGNTGANFLYGLGGADTMNGGTGGDWIDGGTGRDVLTGGSENDRFDFNALTDTGKTAATRDIITDFNHTFDDIDLSTIDARAAAAGNNAFAFIAANAFSGVEGQLHYRYDGTNTIVEGDVNGDRAADFQIQLNGHLTLSAIDFVL